MELTERKKKVLRSVVDLYIRTAEPVGSKAITELPDMKYSSATIRNEMAELTTMGYLEQPHYRSSGSDDQVEGFLHPCQLCRRIPCPNAQGDVYEL